MNWDLSVIFENDEKALDNARSHLENIGKFVDDLEQTTDVEKLVELLRNIEDEMDEFGKSVQYAWMRYSTSTDDPQAQKLFGALQGIETQLGEFEARLFVYLSSLSDSKLNDMIAKDLNYSHFISRVIDNRKHLLSKEAEQVLAATSVSRREAISKIHSRIESSYAFEIEIDGELKTLNSEQMRALRRSTNSELRKRAMKMYLERFKEDSIIMTEVYNLIVKDYTAESKLRRYPRPISMRNFANEVTDESVDRLIEVTNSSVDVVKDYYVWKSKLLNEKLTSADIYAPITKNVRKFSLEEARDIVLNAYYSFDERAGKIVESFFDDSRIDLYPKKGKTSGAYCIYSTTKLPPYVFTNFSGDMNSVMTLAHELGHGLHGSLASKQTYFNHSTPLTLAELASVFGEFLVFDNLKNKLSGEEKKALIATKIEDTFSTTFRQNTFAQFELRAFDLVEKSGYASWDELSEIYYEQLKQMFGESIEIPEWYKNEWAMVSHFYETPFYVYAYNFAHCLVIALYQKYLEDGKNFVPKYIELLESGGKYPPKELLGKMGIDIEGEGFWEKAFTFIGSMTKELM
ncbi:MAG TPA: M3 family oligoendopeptidase [Fervidobacterium sp.]|nr:M3 family oligoendopeptidase [Fervidobacterium sp.]HPT54676.1 M3 family oligoendopeptidase [Fervidobacterium sp.]HPZ18097.1 M3 family oligoendopeptidase [Fervidobacterium sp.]HQE49363.1 M3 family oligoendopeptidase [Fervidobacterium sp.]HUM43150.1 M3 family oligoendopeptidase [Fervidobacterium sp.]